MPEVKKATLTPDVELEALRGTREYLAGRAKAAEAKATALEAVLEVAYSLQAKRREVAVYLSTQNGSGTKTKERELMAQLMDAYDRFDKALDSHKGGTT